MRVEQATNQRDGIEYGLTSAFVKNLSQQYLLSEHKFTPGESYSYLQFAVVKTVNQEGLMTPEFGRIPTDALVNEIYGVYPNCPVLEQLSNFEISPDATSALDVLLQDTEGLLTPGKYPDNNFDAGMARLATFKKLEEFQAMRQSELITGVQPGQLTVADQLKAQIIEYYKAACKSIEPVTYMGDLFAVSLEKQWVSGAISKSEENYSLIKKRCDSMYRLVDEVMKTTFLQTDKGRVLAPLGATDKTFRDAFSDYKFKKTPISNPTKYVALRPTVMCKLSAAGTPETNEKGRVWENGGKVYKSETATLKYVSVVNAKVVEDLDYLKFKYAYPAGEKGISSQGVNLTPYEGTVPTFQEMRNYFIDILVAGPRKFRTFQEYKYQEGLDLVAEFVEKNMGNLSPSALEDHKEILAELGIEVKSDQAATMDTSAIKQGLKADTPVQPQVAQPMPQAPQAQPVPQAPQAPPVPQAPQAPPMGTLPPLPQQPVQG